MITAVALTLAACGDDSNATSTDGFTISGGTTSMTDPTMPGTGSTGSSDPSVGPSSGMSATEGTTMGSNSTVGPTSTPGTTTNNTNTTGPLECVDEDGDGYGAGPGCLGIDCDDNDDTIWADCVGCEDGDGDGYGPGCGADDCDDANPYAWDTCDTCMNQDGDDYWVGCNDYPADFPEPDCDDGDPYNWTPDGCANCMDGDGDMFWVDCDSYDNQQQGPDCDDGNPGVQGDNAVELCNGEAENCAGEIDPLPADEMCPPPGVDPPPNVNPINGWLCDPPAPGEDGCEIQTCLEQYFDIDDDYMNGCECEGTSRNFSLAECSDEMPGFLGSVAEGEEIFGQDLALGVIPQIDNGKGNGAEDWYWVQFPENNAMGDRPQTGIIKVQFDTNDNNDYRFAVYNTCPSVAWDQVAAQCTDDPDGNALEWWFFDNNSPNANYSSSVAWPEEVYIRVFRVKNANTCSTYRLSIKRESN